MIDQGFWRDRTVLVTGATGFLGGWLVARLLDLGARPVCFVRSPRPSSQFQTEGLDARVTVIAAPVEDADAVEAAFAAHDIGAVFHIAALAEVNAALTDPAQNYRTAVLGTLSLLEAARRRGRADCPVVVSSSDKAYGGQPTPYREDMPLAPVHPYEVAKAAQDLMAQSHGRLYRLPVGVTRCGNYFGGWDFNLTRIIPGTIDAVMRGQRPRLRSDGRFTRDFLYIEDAVDVQLLLAQRLVADATLWGEAFNFSHGVEIEIIDIVHRLLELMGSSLPPDIVGDAKAEIRHMALDSSKARTRLGWQARHGFDGGLVRTVDWYRRHWHDRA